LGTSSPPLTAADLQAAWSYFEQHTEEIEHDIRENESALTDNGVPPTEPQLSEEELQRREQEPDSTTAELLARLEKL
jgi:hypothetical protein